MVGHEALDVAPLGLAHGEVALHERGGAHGVGATRRRVRLVTRRQADRAPLAGRREGRLGDGHPPRRRHGCRDGLARLVERGAAGDHEGHRRSRARLLAIQWQDLLELQLVGRQGAGLVHAEHVHVAERLDRVGLLHERPVAGHAHGGQGIGDGDRHEEAVGDEADQDRGLDDGLVEWHVQQHVLDDEQQLQVEDDGQGHADDGLDLPLQRRQRPSERARTGRDAPRQAGFADGLGHVAAAPGGRVAARVDLVARPLGHEVRFAGQLRLVDFDATLRQATVHDDLVAGLDGHEVAHDELLWPDLAYLTVAHDLGRRPRQQGDAVQGLLGAHLLDDAHHDVGADDGQ